MSQNLWNDRNKMAEEIIKHDRKKKRNGTSNKHTLKTLFQPFGLFSPDMACIPPRICIACCPLQHFSVLAGSLITFTTISSILSDSWINGEKWQKPVYLCTFSKLTLSLLPSTHLSFSI